MPEMKRELKKQYGECLRCLRGYPETQKFNAHEAEDLDPRGGRESERRPPQNTGNLKELNLW